MEGLALAILIAAGMSSLWDLIEPDAWEVKVNSPARVVFAFVAAMAGIVLPLLVLHAAPIVFVLVFTLLFALVCFRAAMR